MSATRIEPTIAFFGATGGVTGACLVHTLRAGHKCVALVRTPDKLRKQLEEQGITEPTLSSQLLIVSGSATDKSAVKSTLTVGGAGTLPSIIITGVGAAPKFGGWRLVTIDQPTLCGDSAKTLVEALTEVYNEQPKPTTNKPSLVFVSTTGISRGVEDVPFGMRFLYHQLLHTPHLDKKQMEDTFRDSTGTFKSLTGIRPTLLSGTTDVKDVKGLEFVKAGTEDKPATGFSIGRADVGHWMFENLLNDAGAQKKWEGQMISLTY